MFCIVSEIVFPKSKVKHVVNIQKGVKLISFYPNRSADTYFNSVVCLL